ncbi:PREDICTED: uncharacterized protein LOC109484895 [Branchiostoma belcheri]|uniref:Uncharacterized protein LOC109484895 n=1 Tax=Branchiostoma belcheri TaxID=7741 RepID=A0A6P5AP47_BRABE|nr:PREDICTED: uncharacterized protein LOC109484895 [Branchiostoma belcheri]
MGGKLRHMLIFLLIILEVPNMARKIRCKDCAPASSYCRCNNMGLYSIPQHLPTSISGLVLAGNLAGVVLVGTIFLTVWYKRRTRHPPLRLSPNVVGGNTNTAVSVMTSGHDSQYGDIDNHRDQTGRCQSQAIAESNMNTMATVMTSGHDHQYEDIDNHRDQTGQGQSQANIQPLSLHALARSKVLAALKPNTMYQGVEIPPPNDPTSTISRSQTGQNLFQAITESTTNTTATVMTSGHDQTEQGQSGTTNARNLSYGTGPIASQLNSLY